MGKLTQKAKLIIDSCTNEQHVQVAARFTELLINNPALKLTNEDTNTLLHALNSKIASLQAQVRLQRAA